MDGWMDRQTGGWTDLKPTPHHHSHGEMGMEIHHRYHIYGCHQRRMDGWMDEWMNGWLDGRVDG